MRFFSTACLCQIAQFVLKQIQQKFLKFYNMKGCYIKDKAIATFYGFNKMNLQCEIKFLFNT